jgi:hypothetical protein
VAAGAGAAAVHALTVLGERIAAARAPGYRSDFTRLPQRKVAAPI